MTLGQLHIMEQGRVLRETRNDRARCCRVHGYGLPVRATSASAAM